MTIENINELPNHKLIWEISELEQRIIQANKKVWYAETEVEKYEEKLSLLKSEVLRRMPKLEEKESAPEKSVKELKPDEIHGK